MHDIANVMREYDDVDDTTFERLADEVSGGVPKPAQIRANAVERSLGADDRLSQVKSSAVIFGEAADVDLFGSGPGRGEGSDDLFSMIGAGEESNGVQSDTDTLASLLSTAEGALEGQGAAKGLFD